MILLATMRWITFAGFALAIAGCAATKEFQRSGNSVESTEPEILRSESPSSAEKMTPISVVAYQVPADSTSGDSQARAEVAVSDSLRSEAAINAIPGFTSLEELELLAQASNPTLRQLQQEYQAARAKVRHVDELPDPTIGTNVFVHPIETAAGSQRANVTVSQMLPWLARLDAQEQQACFEAMALSQVAAAERLRIMGDLRVLWYQLFVIEKQIQVNSGSQELLQSLIEVANARVATGNASQGDVLKGTLEYSKLEETLIALRQRRDSTAAEINRLVSRDLSTPIASPVEIIAELPDWDHAVLRSLALENHPEIESARIRAQATRWGVEVARLKRRPDVSVSASWFAMDDNRPPSTVVDVGRDAWSLGAMMSIPVWREKYNAIDQEARWKHAASHASVEQVTQRYDKLLFDLLAQARAADDTCRLYRDTILPEARRTLNADQESYSTNGDVEFDRVVLDFRDLLTLELGYYRTLGQLATSVARIEQTIGSL